MPAHDAEENDGIEGRRQDAGKQYALRERPLGEAVNEPICQLANCEGCDRGIGHERVGQEIRQDRRNQHGDQYSGGVPRLPAWNDGCLTGRGGRGTQVSQGIHAAYS